MTEPVLAPTTEALTSFFKRLEDIETILRIIVSGARIRALLTFRGEPEKKVLLDFSNFPARVAIDDQARDIDVFVTINGEAMHKVMSGQMSAGTALARRELLLRGSASNLASLIPLFDFGPVLYREHLDKSGLLGPSRPLSRNTPEEEFMGTDHFKGNPIPVVRLSAFERVVFGILGGVSYALGYFVGLVRYRIFKKLNLFDVLSAMSRGLAAAEPKARLESSNPSD